MTISTNFKSIYSILIILFFLASFSSCNTIKRTFPSKQYKLENKISNSVILQDEFTGFVLYDIDKHKNVININGNKYFTPASNTKILTYYTSTMILGDSLPLLKYVIKGDSLIFWGTGNPLVLNPDFVENKTTIDFLKNSKKQLYFCDNNFTDEKYGSGWAWDDFLYYYQLEKSPFPIYGNRVLVSFNKDSTNVSPFFFNESIVFDIDSNRYQREQDDNLFSVGSYPDKTKIEIPFITNTQTTIDAIKYYLKQDIGKCPEINYDSSIVHIYKFPFPDSIYIRLLHQSDNFIAEQLILMCSSTLFDTLNTQKAIKWSLLNLLPDIKDKSRWVDGSGLSRYNLFSPETFIYTLNKIHEKISWNDITKLFPSIGISGTLKNTYSNIGKPYIYAKSGSLSNNYNLSGYIITKKNNKYIFSFMNNHFLGSNKKIKNEMEKIFQWIYENM